MLAQLHNNTIKIIIVILTDIQHTSGQVQSLWGFTVLGGNLIKFCHELLSVS